MYLCMYAFSDSNSRDCYPGEWACPGAPLCVPVSKVCDGHADCPNGVDETNATAQLTCGEVPGSWERASLITILSPLFQFIFVFRCFVTHSLLQSQLYRSLSNNHWASPFVRVSVCVYVFLTRQECNESSSSFRLLSD